VKAPEARRQRNAVWVLRQAGTPEAERLRRHWAGGAAGDLLTREALTWPR
jgi:hypothetical protein